jgi:hypothetical protein
MDKKQVGHKVIDRHCDCMFLVNTEGRGWTTIAALVSPRPLLFANSDEDPYFPIDANRRTFDRLRRFCTTAGVPQNVAKHIRHGNHGDRADLRQATYCSFRVLPNEVPPARTKPTTDAATHLRWLETESGIVAFAGVSELNSVMESGFWNRQFGADSCLICEPFNAA